MPITEVFAGIAVRDRDAAIEFYERLLGAAPTMLPNDGEAAWQLTGGGWLYLLCDASSRVIGCPARWRSARSTAAVFVRTPKRSMIAWI
jgi:catechol 2,3-dioxygenase-like lactoylglutathione lyase family enzyme